MEAMYRVYSWGFPKEELRIIPDHIKVTQVTGHDWPKDGPVLVHLTAYELFKEEVVNYPRPDGVLPDALLYLPHGSVKPEDAWVFCDEVIAEDEWIELEDLLSCPRIFHSGGLASDLELSFLRLLQASGASISDVTFSDLPSAIPFEDRVHLAVCPHCHLRFEDKVNSRIKYLQKWGILV